MDINGINGSLTNFIAESTQAKAETDDFEKLLKEAQETQDKEELREACREFESYFVKQMYTVMRNSVPEGTLTEKSHGREIFEDLLDEEYAEEASAGKGMGIADMLYRQLSKDNKLI